MSWLLAFVELVAALYLLYRIFDDAVVAGISIWKAARDEAREGRRLDVIQAGAEARRSSRLEKGSSNLS